jgi:hypothetical protein
LTLKTGITGKPYSTHQVDYDADGQPVGEVFTGAHGKLYDSDTITTTKDGYIETRYSGGTAFAHTSTFAYTEGQDPDGSFAYQRFANDDGTHTTFGLENDLRLHAQYDDTLTGGGTNETFVYRPHPGQSTITDFIASGQGHDVLDLSKLSFSSLVGVLANTTSAADGSAILHLGPQDSITLQGVTVADLQANPHDLKFHLGK